MARLLALGMARLLGMFVWTLRQTWVSFSARARIFLIIIALVLVSSATSSIAPSISATGQGLAVLLLAFVGLWMILTAPFRDRRW